MGSNEQASPAQIEKFLSGVDYPVPKEKLLERAKEQDAPKDVRTVLSSLPDKEYQSPTEVSQEVGRIE